MVDVTSVVTCIDDCCRFDDAEVVSIVSEFGYVPDAFEASPVKTIDESCVDR